MKHLTEEWVIRVDNQNFTTNRAGKEKVVQAMQNNKRFVALSGKDIISVRHISYLYRASKQIKNQLRAGKEKVKVFTPLSKEKLKKIRKEAFAKIGKI